MSKLNSLPENFPLSRSNSPPKKFETLQDTKFDLPFKQSLFRSKLNAFVHQTVIEKAILQPYISQTQVLEKDLDLNFLQSFEKLQGLNSVLD